MNFRSKNNNVLYRTVLVLVRVSVQSTPELVLVPAFDADLCVLEVHVLDPVVKHLEVLVLLHVDKVLKGFNDDDQLLLVLLDLLDTSHQNVLVLLCPGFDIGLPTRIHYHVKIIFLASQLLVRIGDQCSKLVELDGGNISVNLEHLL